MARLLSNIVIPLTLISCGCVNGSNTASDVEAVHIALVNEYARFLRKDRATWIIMRFLQMKTLEPKVIDEAGEPIRIYMRYFSTKGGLFSGGIFEIDDTLFDKIENRAERFSKYYKNGDASDEKDFSTLKIQFETLLEFLRKNGEALIASNLETILENWTHEKWLVLYHKLVEDFKGKASSICQKIDEKRQIFSEKIRKFSVSNDQDLETAAKDHILKQAFIEAAAGLQGVYTNNCKHKWHYPAQFEPYYDNLLIRQVRYAEDALLLDELANHITKYKANKKKLSNQRWLAYHLYRFGMHVDLTADQNTRNTVTGRLRLLETLYKERFCRETDTILTEVRKYEQHTFSSNIQRRIEQIQKQRTQCTRPIAIA